MYYRLSGILSLALFAGLAFGQAPASPKVDRVFHFNADATQVQMTAMATLLRTLVGTVSLPIDITAKTLSINDTLDNVGLAEWVFTEITQNASAPHPTPPNAGLHEYRVSATADDFARVMYVVAGATQQDTTEMATTIRTVVDVMRLFPWSHPQNAIVLRGTAAQMAMTDWIFNQVNKPPRAPAQSGDPLPPVAEYRIPGDTKMLTQIYFLNPSATNQELTELVTAIRTIAEVNRLFPLQGQHAIIGKAENDSMAAAQWLYKELANPANSQAPGNAPHEFQMNDPHGNSAVRVFYLTNGDSKTLNSAVIQIRTKTFINRMFPISARKAIALRGRPDQVIAAERMLVELDTPAQVAVK